VGGFRLDFLYALCGQNLVEFGEAMRTINLGLCKKAKIVRGFFLSYCDLSLYVDSFMARFAVIYLVSFYKSCDAPSSSSLNV